MFFTLHAIELQHCYISVFVKYFYFDMCFLHPLYTRIVLFMLHNNIKDAQIKYILNFKKLLSFSGPLGLHKCPL